MIGFMANRSTMGRAEFAFTEPSSRDPAPTRFRTASGHAALACAFLVLFAASCSSAGEEGAPAASDVTVVWGGGLFDGTGDAVVPNPGSWWRRGASRPSSRGGSEAVAAGATVVEVGEGEVVLPGLFDLHAHFHLDLLGEGRVDETGVYPALFLANGVTNTFPNGEASPHKMRALQERLRSGEQVGARLHRSGPYFGTARVGWVPTSPRRTSIARSTPWSGRGWRA